MRLTTIRPFTIGLAAIAAVAFGVVPAALAQSPKSVVSGLQENQELIRVCRKTTQSAEVFDNTNLGPSTNRIGTLQAGAEVSLTGVVLSGLSSGRAQIIFRNNSNSQLIGWINAAFLSPCGSNQQQGMINACFRAEVPLDARSEPSSSGSITDRYQSGGIFRATYRARDNSGRSWLEIISIDGGRDWVIEITQDGRVNAREITCP